jgi:hypothetical protein
MGRAACRSCRKELFAGRGGEVHSRCMVVVYEELGEGVVVGETGKMYCSSCAKTVGRCRWRGARCACGKWVIPFIALHISKIDIF